MTRYLEGLGLLCKAGYSLPGAMDECADIAGNQVLDTKLRELGRQALRGPQTPAQLLVASGFLKPHVNSLLLTAEQTGEQDVMLLRAAEYYRSDLHQRALALPWLVIVGSTVLAGIPTGVAVYYGFVGYVDSLITGVDRFMGVN